MRDSWTPLVIAVVSATIFAGCLGSPKPMPLPPAPVAQDHLWARNFRADTYVGNKDDCRYGLVCFTQSISTVLLRVPDNSTLEALDLQVTVRIPQGPFTWTLACTIGVNACNQTAPSGTVNGQSFSLHLPGLGFPATADVVWLAGDNRTFPMQFAQIAHAELIINGTATFQGGPARPVEERSHVLDFQTSTGTCAPFAEPRCNDFAAVDSQTDVYLGLLHKLDVVASWNSTPSGQILYLRVMCQSGASTRCAGGSERYYVKGSAPLHLVVPNLGYQGGRVILEVAASQDAQNVAPQRTPVHLHGTVVEEIASDNAR